jgi:hypothetical protein
VQVGMLCCDDHLSAEMLQNISNNAKQGQTSCTASSCADPLQKPERKCDEMVYGNAMMPKISVDEWHRGVMHSNGAMAGTLVHTPVSWS